jgi:hypothetical protein
MDPCNTNNTEKKYLIGTFVLIIVLLICITGDKYQNWIFTRNLQKLARLDTRDQIMRNIMNTI